MYKSKLILTKKYFGKLYVVTADNKKIIPTNFIKSLLNTFLHEYVIYQIFIQDLRIVPQSTLPQDFISVTSDKKKKLWYKMIKNPTLDLEVDDTKLTTYAQYLEDKEEYYPNISFEEYKEFEMGKTYGTFIITKKELEFSNTKYNFGEALKMIETQSIFQIELYPERSFGIFTAGYGDGIFIKHCTPEAKKILNKCLDEYNSSIE